MGSHRLGVFKGATVIQVCGDARSAERVIADRRGTARIARAALKHAPRVGLAHRAIRKNAGAPIGRAEKGTLAIPVSNRNPFDDVALRAAAGDRKFAWS